MGSIKSHVHTAFETVLRETNTSVRDHQVVLVGRGSMAGAAADLAASNKDVRGLVMIAPKGTTNTIGKYHSWSKTKVPCSMFVVGSSAALAGRRGSLTEGFLENVLQRKVFSYKAGWQATKRQDGSQIFEFKKGWEAKPMAA